MSMILDGTNGATFNDGSLQAAAASPYVLKNRIINGDMRIDQRNAGASVTPTATETYVYTLDRWSAVNSQASKFSVQQSSTAPAGFNNSLLVTSLSAYSIVSSDYFQLIQPIEGLNVSDLAWGTASAATVTLSFWVRSSLTGTFGGAITNSNNSRSYPFSYTISAANTFEQKFITIAGDTTGTWLTTNGIGLQIRFGLGVGSTYSGTAGAWAGTVYASTTGATSVVGTNGATFYITGVQLEIGSTATPFERRLYGQELALCQRYYQLVSALFGGGNSSTQAAIQAPFQVPMRVAPTLGQQGVIQLSDTGTDYTQSSVSITSLGSTNNSSVFFLGNFSGLTINRVLIGPRNSATTSTVTLSAEL